EGRGRAHQAPALLTPRLATDADKQQELTVTRLAAPTQLTLSGTEGPPAMTAAEHPCEQCGTRSRRHSKRDSLLCPACRERRAHARYAAAGRAHTWLATEHAEAYANLYAEHVARAHAQDPGARSLTI